MDSGASRAPNPMMQYTNVLSVDPQLVEGVQDAANVMVGVLQETNSGYRYGREPQE